MIAARRRARAAHEGTAGAGGQGFADFALLVLLVLALALLVFAGGVLTANWLALGSAAREAASAGAAAGATDADVLDAVNRSASLFTGTYATVTPNTPPSACTAAEAVCVCRHPPGAATCRGAAARDDVIEVTVRHRFVFVPGAGGFVGQNAALQLVASAQARVQ